MLGNLDENSYLEIISGALNETVFTSTDVVSYLTYLCNSILEAFQGQWITEETSHKLLSLLGYLVGVEDLAHPRFPSYGFGNYPAYEVILDIGKIVGKGYVLEDINRVYRRTNIKLVREKLRRLIIFLEEE